ncbi:DUF427 domain-containing protein [Ruania suaedae]|uniref:DUF427 domain-containing protein n=1 Tax=Ruania suaedae TaxID=2897774 RepID=UPI001E5B116F|nr:DUF427 domain-containing protein [Ruania suaedae]UFU03646.1 DUF427 domain-containing protein [Ruania suaedae]
MRHPRPDPVGPGQESVWDYPRPPRVRGVDGLVTITLGGELIATTQDAVSALETSHPPVYYLPISAFGEGVLTAGEGSSFCEFKGAARYFDVHGGGQTRLAAAWTYPRPNPGYEALADRVAVYAQGMDECTVAGEVVRPQPGQFYGGWVTSSVAGPFKGEPGSMGW